MTQIQEKLRILHTSDWHLGKSLYDKKRYDEFSQFLDWLILLLKEQQINVLLIAGDIFDTTTPSNKAQELYYKFLSKVSNTGCRHVVAIGGNHDSPTFLNAPQNLLKSLNVHVIGSATENLNDEVVVLKNEQNDTEAIVCAVPFLRDRDIRTVTEDESVMDKTQKIIQGTANHYSTVESIALSYQNQTNPVPIIGMGHLFSSGGKTTEGDGVRDLYIGTLGHVDKSIFSNKYSYVALGHLHMPQTVGGSDTIRYSGSPIQMGFGETGQTKKVIIVEFEQEQTNITEHEIPCFQKLIKVCGDFNEIINQITKLKNIGENAWLEIELTANELISNISELLDEIVDDSSLEILRIKNKFITDRTLSSQSVEESLEELNEHEVFQRCLDIYEIEEEERKSLVVTYDEVLHVMQENDIKSE